MTQAEALRLAAYIAGAYRNADSSNAALAVLADQLTDLDHDRAKGVVREIVAAGGPFAPAAGEIRNAYFASVHRLPTVGGIVNEIAAAREKPIGDAVFSHPIVREVALEVGYAKIREEWSFAHREVQGAAERLHAEFLRAVNVASLTGREPNLRGRLALAARGVDYFAAPPVPEIEAGWTWHGWTLDLPNELWSGRMSGPDKDRDYARYECPMLYVGCEVDSMPPVLGLGVALKMLPAGGWTMPQPKRTSYSTVALYWERFKKERAREDAENAARAEERAKRAEVERIIKADPTTFKAMTFIERAALVRKMMAEVVLPKSAPTPG